MTCLDQVRNVCINLLVAQHRHARLARRRGSTVGGSLLLHGHTTRTCSLCRRPHISSGKAYRDNFNCYATQRRRSILYDTDTPQNCWWRRPVSYKTARSCTIPTHHKTVSGDTQSCTRPTHHKTSSGDTQSCTRPFVHIALPPGTAPNGECNEVADVQPKYLTHSTQCLGGIWLVILHVDYAPIWRQMSKVINMRCCKQITSCER